MGSGVGRVTWGRRVSSQSEEIEEREEGGCAKRACVRERGSCSNSWMRQHNAASKPLLGCLAALAPLHIARASPKHRSLLPPPAPPIAVRVKQA
jgi:hypothetical protein